MDTTVASAADRATGPAIKQVKRTADQVAAGTPVTGQLIADTIAAYRRTGHRGNDTRRPSRRQIRAFYTFAAGSAA